MQQQSSDMYVELAAAAATASSSASSAPRPSTSSSTKASSTKASSAEANNDEHKVDRDSSVSGRSKKHQKQQQRHNSRKFYKNTREPVAVAEAAEEDKSHEERATVKTAGRSAVRQLMAELNILATETSTVSAQELKKQKKDINAFMDGLISQLKLNVDVLRLKMNSYRACDVQVQTTLLCGTAAISFITGMEVFYKSYNSGAASAATDLVNSSSSSVISDGDTSETATSSSSGGLSPGASLAFSVVVFIIAASMGLLSAVTKFVGRKDKSDAMAQVVFKASAVIADIPQAQQQLKLIQTREELEMRLEAFLGREYKSWLDAMRSIESIMSLQSLTDHLPDFYMLSLRNIRDAHLYESHAARYSNRGQSPLHYYHQQQQQQQQRNNFADAALPLPSLSPSSLLGPLPQNNLATYVEKTTKHDAAANESKNAADQEEEVHVNIETDQTHSASV
jgi:hypothetical protein